MKYETSMNEVSGSMGWNSWPSSKLSRLNSLKVVKTLCRLAMKIIFRERVCN